MDGLKLLMFLYFFHCFYDLLEKDSFSAYICVCESEGQKVNRKVGKFYLATFAHKININF